MDCHHQTSCKTASSSSAGIIRRAKPAVRRNPLHLLFLLALLALASCGKDGPTRSTGPASVVVTPEAVTLAAIGQSVQLDARVQDEDGATLSGQAVVWSSRNPSVASVSGGGARHRARQRDGGYNGHRGTETGNVHGYGIPVGPDDHHRTVFCSADRGRRDRQAQGLGVGRKRPDHRRRGGEMDGQRRVGGDSQR